MDHKPHVRFVDPHAECVGGDDHPHLAPQPGLLLGRPHPVPQPGVVEVGRDTLVGQLRGDLLRPPPRAGVDDPRPLDPPDHPQELFEFVFDLPHHESDVGPGERPAKNLRFVQPQVLSDVLQHERRGRGRQRHERSLRHPLPEAGDPQVGGPEVVPPLRDAVSLVDRHQRDIHFPHPGVKNPRLDPLRRDIEQLHIPVHAVIQRDIDLPGGHGRVDRDGIDPPPPKGVDLVFHQSDERRDDDRHPRQSECRDLVAERLSAAGGQQRQRIAAGHHRRDNLALQRPEAPVAPVGLEYFLRVCHSVSLPFPSPTTRTPPSAHPPPTSTAASPP